MTQFKSTFSASQKKKYLLRKKTNASMEEIFLDQLLDHYISIYLYIYSLKFMNISKTLTT